MEQKNELTNEQSLAIITKMIQTAKGNAKARSFYFLFWGWLVVIASTAQFYLDQYTTFDHPYMVWLISIPGWIVSMIYGYKQSSKDRVKTYSDNLVMWVWIGFVFSILIIIGGSRYFNYQVTALILLFSGFSTFVTGLIIRFRPLILGGSTFWIFTPIALYLGIHYAPLVMAVAIIVGYLIPGYMLKKAK